MKRFFALLAVALVFFFGCASFGQIQHQHMVNLKGDIDAYRAYVYSSGTSPGTLVSMIRLERNGAKGYGLEVWYRGYGWRFMDKATLAVDGQLYDLSDDQPSRGILNNGIVSETIELTLPEEAVSAMATSNDIKLQYYGEPITIPPKGLEAIHKIIALP